MGAPACGDCAGAPGPAPRPRCAKAGGAAARKAMRTDTNGIVLVTLMPLPRRLRCRRPGRTQAAIGRLDEGIRRPEALGGAITAVVVADQPRRLHLLEGHLLPDCILKAIAENRGHI